MRGSIVLSVVLASMSGSGAFSQSAPPSSLDTVFVQDTTAAWLSQWRDSQSERFGQIFKPKTIALDLDRMVAEIGGNPNAIGLVPSGVALTDGASGIVRRPAGVAVCLWPFVQSDGNLRSVGDLHALPGRQQLTAAADVRHMVSWMLELYDLEDATELVSADSVISTTLIEAGDVEIAFISGGSEMSVSVLGGSLEFAKPLPISGAVRTAALREGYLAGEFLMPPERFLDSAINVAAICDPVDIIANVDAPYDIGSLAIDRLTAFEDKPDSLFHRTLNAIAVLVDMIESPEE